MMLLLPKRERLYGGDVEGTSKALGVCKGSINTDSQIKRNGDAEIHRERTRVALAVGARL